MGLFHGSLLECEVALRLDGWSQLMMKTFRTGDSRKRDRSLPNPPLFPSRCWDVEKDGIEDW
jgi:hypothetical protein